MAAGPVSRLGSFEPGDKTGLRLSPHLAPTSTGSTGVTLPTGSRVTSKLKTDGCSTAPATRRSCGLVAMPPTDDDHIDWQSLGDLVGHDNARQLRLVRRTDAQFANNPMLRLMNECAKQMATQTGEARRKTREDFMQQALRLQAISLRTARAARYACNRNHHIAGERLDRVSQRLLRLRRLTLPVRFELHARARFATWREALAKVGAESEPSAGDFLLELSEQVSKMAHERSHSTAGKLLRAVQTTLNTNLVHGECVICSQRRPRVALSSCGHVCSCHRCVHLHVIERLRAGTRPACPLCRAPLSEGELLSFMAPYNRVVPFPREHGSPEGP